jgi:hypothetical protein
VGAARKKLKASEAIRKGIALDGKQIRGTLFELNDKGKLVGCCALGAMALGGGWRPEIEPIVGSTSGPLFCLINEFAAEDILEAKFHEAQEAYFERYGASIDSDNDYHKLSRQQIARRLEKIGF